MAELVQEHQTQRIRRRPQNIDLAESQDTSEQDKAIREQLSKLDAAVNEYLTDTSAADNAATVGLPQTHVRAKPLSDEAIVRDFRQTRGE